MLPLFLLLLPLLPGAARAHCDSLDGPVVHAAKEALATGRPEPALAWVKADDESEVTAALRSALAVRGLSPQAQALADSYFYETLVRLHRAGEGAPFTGLKPAGLDRGPAIPAADKAILTGNVEPLRKLLAAEAQSGLSARMKRLVELGKHRDDDVESGRRWVEAYVEFVHYAERLHVDATTDAAGHESEAAPHVD
jgi:hypothetical protein